MSSLPRFWSRHTRAIVIQKPEEESLNFWHVCSDLVGNVTQLGWCLRVKVYCEGDLGDIGKKRSILRIV